MNRIGSGRDTLTETVGAEFNFITGSVLKKYPAGTVVHLGGFSI